MYVHVCQFAQQLNFWIFTNIALFLIEINYLILLGANNTEYNKIQIAQINIKNVTKNKG